MIYRTKVWSDCSGQVAEIKSIDVIHNLMTPRQTNCLLSNVGLSGGGDGHGDDSGQHSGPAKLEF